MKMRLWGIGIVLIVCAAAIGCVTYPYQPVSYGSVPVASAPAPPPAGGSDQPFYDDLAPYGRWVYVSGPGWVWSPNNVQAGWRPYQLGHWVFTDAGWTWASDEEWGWAVYHYGRWNQDPSYGWVWVPGTEWGPAWVAWHEGGGFVGWAPLPWQVRIQAGVGLTGAGINVSIEPSWWSFVSAVNLVDPTLHRHIEPAVRNVALIQVTRNVTNYTYIDNRIVNQGVQVEKIGKALGHTIPRYHLTDDDSSGIAHGGKVRGEDFVVFRPKGPRGRMSEGRPVPPGHDEAHRPGDFRPGEFRSTVTPPTPAPVPVQSVPAPGSPQTPPQPAPPTAQPAAQTAPPARTPPPMSRGRKFLDRLVGKEDPRHSPQQAAPSQPPAPGQPATPAQPAVPGHPATPAPPAVTGQPVPPGQTVAPGRSAEPQQAPPGREKAKGPKNPAAEAKKPKPNGPKPEASNGDKSKAEKPDSGH